MPWKYRSGSKFWTIFIRLLLTCSFVGRTSEIWVGGKRERGGEWAREEALLPFQMRNCATPKERSHLFWFPSPPSLRRESTIPSNQILSPERGYSPKKKRRCLRGVRRSFAQVLRTSLEHAVLLLEYWEHALQCKLYINADQPNSQVRTYAKKFWRHFQEEPMSLSDIWIDAPWPAIVLSTRTDLVRAWVFCPVHRIRPTG